MVKVEINQENLIKGDLDAKKLYAVSFASDQNQEHQDEQIVDLWRANDDEHLVVLINNEIDAYQSEGINTDYANGCTINFIEIGNVID